MDPDKVVLQQLASIRFPGLFFRGVEVEEQHVAKFQPVRVEPPGLAVLVGIDQFVFAAVAPDEIPCVVRAHSALPKAEQGRVERKLLPGVKRIERDGKTA